MHLTCRLILLLVFVSSSRQILPTQATSIPLSIHSNSSFIPNLQHPILSHTKSARVMGAPSAYCSHSAKQEIPYSCGTHNYHLNRHKLLLLVAIPTTNFHKFHSNIILPSILWSNLSFMHAKYTAPHIHSFHHPNSVTSTSVNIFACITLWEYNKVLS